MSSLLNIFAQDTGLVPISREELLQMEARIYNSNQPTIIDYIIDFSNTLTGNFLIGLFLMWLIPKFWRRFGKTLTNNRLVHWLKREMKSTFDFWFGWLKAVEDEADDDTTEK